MWKQFKKRESLPNQYFSWYLIEHILWVRQGIRPSANKLQMTSWVQIKKERKSILCWIMCEYPMHTTTASTEERIVCEFERNKDKEMSKEPSTCHQTCSLYNHTDDYSCIRICSHIFQLFDLTLSYIFTTHLIKSCYYFKGTILHGESAKGNRKWSNK